MQYEKNWRPITIDFGTPSKKTGLNVDGKRDEPIPDQECIKNSYHVIYWELKLEEGDIVQIDHVTFIFSQILVYLETRFFIEQKSESFSSQIPKFSNVLMSLLLKNNLTRTRRKNLNDLDNINI